MRTKSRPIWSSSGTKASLSEVDQPTPADEGASVIHMGIHVP